MNIIEIVESSDEPPPNQIRFNKGTGNQHRDVDRSNWLVCGLLARGGTLETGYIRVACLLASREYSVKRLALANQALG